MKNAILVDFDVPDKWEFHDAMEKATNQTWIVKKASVTEITAVYYKS